MLQNRKVIGFFIGDIVANIAYAFLLNIVSNALLTKLQPYLWLTVLLIPICYIAANKFKKSPEQTVLEKNAGANRPGSSPQELQVPSNNLQPQQSTTIMPEFRQPAQFHSTSSILSRPINFPEKEMPSMEDDFDDDAPHFVDDPLPQKPQRAAELKVSELIAGLPTMDFEESSKITLPEGPTIICWSPDGKALACAFPEHEPMLLTESETVMLPLDWGLVQALCWSLDGRILAVSAQGTIHFWDVMSHKESGQSLRVSAKPVYGLDWSVREQLAVWTDSDMQIFTSHDFSSPQTLSMQQMHCDKFGLLRWSPDGSWLAMGATSHGGKLLCWNIDTKLQQVVLSNLRPLTLEWLPKSSSLIATFRDRQTIVWNADANQIMVPWEKLPVSPRTLSISIDQYVVVASNRNELLFGRLNEAFPSSKYKGQLLAIWSPQQTKLATLDEQKETSLIILSPRSDYH